eukprot:TRINITY_DN15977_c0_g1_i2.p2 TRINITY_DN15977_c0_g1~~TRINITY_DN15977_c0_g1_i2.p2  ORF type:complete len:101 (-),score=2.10 TRINITY_DN15977_c0_g1_i2:162-464(-)
MGLDIYSTLESYFKVKLYCHSSQLESSFQELELCLRLNILALEIQKQMKIKILHIIDSFNIGGLENGLINIINKSDKIFEHEICCIKNNGSAYSLSLIHI